HPPTVSYPHRRLGAIGKSLGLWLHDQSSADTMTGDSEIRGDLREEPGTAWAPTGPQRARKKGSTGRNRHRKEEVDMPHHLRCRRSWSTCRAIRPRSWIPSWKSITGR